MYITNKLLSRCIRLTNMVNTHIMLLKCINVEETHYMTLSSIANLQILTVLYAAGKAYMAEILAISFGDCYKSAQI